MNAEDERQEGTVGDWYWPLMACPRCGNAYDIKDDEVCVNCGIFTWKSGDFRLNCTSILTSLTVPRTFGIDGDAVAGLGSINTAVPKITYTGPRAQRDSRELMSVIAKHLDSPGRVLDLGCGPRDQAKPVEYLGHRYVGVDYSNPAADFLADAHGLPFQSGVFDCVLSYAVLEHLHNPHVAIREVARVLRPGGIYIGTVSQGEPFHHSFFHMTAWGLLSLVHTVPDLQVKRLWATGDTLAALSRMGAYPKVVRWMLKVVDRIHVGLPWLAPRKMRWPEKEKEIDRLNRAGSIGFVIVKDSVAETSGVV